MKQKQLRALMERHQANCARINEIAQACETENRTRTPEEDAEYETLKRDNDIVAMKIAGLQAKPVAVANPNTQLRENLFAGKKVALVLTRDETVEPSTLNTTADLAGTGIIPIQQQQMLKPLREGLIYDKVGLKIGFGLRGGTLRWPRHGKLIAKWRKEGERAGDQKIDWSKLETNPEGLSVAVSVTREELNDSDGIVESVVTEEMPSAIYDAVNDALFTTEGTYLDKTDNKTKTKAVVGPFVKAAATPFDFAGDVPTRKELLKMKAKVASCGLPMVAPCWVMTEAMKAELEDQKVDTGSGRFTCENDHILGYPVFTTPVIGEGNVGFGDWAYQAAGFFDSMNILVDPYTLSRQNAVDFVLHARFATVTLYEEAFVVGKKKATVQQGG